MFKNEYVKVEKSAAINPIAEKESSVAEAKRYRILKDIIFLLNSLGLIWFNYTVTVILPCAPNDHESSKKNKT